MPEVAAAAAGFDLSVVEDACHALGGEYVSADGAWGRIGSCRDTAMTVFSLHPVKTLTMGEGGVVTTNDPELAIRMRRLRNHDVVREPSAFENDALAFDADGAANPWYAEFQELGFNYRASDMQCALGLSQLAKLDRFVAARRGLAGYYRERLPSVAPFVAAVGRAPGCHPAWHLAVAMIDFEVAGISRGTLMRRLAGCGIGSQVHYVPLHRQPCYRRSYGDVTLPGADRYYARCLSLPLFPTMSACDVDRVIDALAASLQAKSTP
jgi:dTDP-4-amino-4,6-dideoxygalactose transaminase